MLALVAVAALGVFAVGGSGSSDAAANDTVASAAFGTDAFDLVDGPTTAAWVTSPTDDARRLTAAQQTTAPATRTIVVDLADRRQTWSGVGAALTDASTELLAGNGAALDLLFADDAPDGARLNLVRLPLSATDFSTDAWTWEVDAASGGVRPPAPALRSIDVLDEIAGRVDGLAVAAAAWAPPSEFADPIDGAGVALRAGSEAAYADVLAAQAAWLVDRGVPLEWISLGNEPGHVAEYPTALIDDTQLIELATEVAPQLDDLDVDLLAVDHNWADRDRVDAVLAGAPGAFDAAAFHCYDGEPTDMAGLEVPALVTECTGTTDTWAGTFAWDARQLIEGSIESGSTGLLMWNLALDPDHGPKADWGCADCRGLLTIDSNGVIEPGPEFYVLAHLARAATPGSTVLGTTSDDDVAVAAFQHADGTVGVVGHNASDAAQVVEIAGSDGRTMSVLVDAGDLFTVTL